MQTMGNWTKRLVIASAVFLAASAAARAADDMGKMPMGAKISRTRGEARRCEASGGQGRSASRDRHHRQGLRAEQSRGEESQPVEFVFTWKTDQTCIKDLVLDTGSKKIEKKLPLNTPVTIKTQFKKAGELNYACNMNMFSGTVMVQ